MMGSHMSDEQETPDGLVKVTVYITQDNFDRMFETAVGVGDTNTDTINRALSFYWLCMTSPRWSRITWRYKHGAIGRVIKTK